MAQETVAPKATKAAQNGRPPLESFSSVDVREFFGKMQPFIEKLMDVYAIVAPNAQILYHRLKYMYYTYGDPYVKQYHLKDASSLILGLVLLFFGGSFAMTIACYFALKLSGWHLVVSSYKEIKSNYDAAMEAFRNDKDARSVFDKDGDGNITPAEIKSAAQLWLNGTKEEKLEILSHFRNVLIAVDPKQVMNGLAGLWSVFVTLLATLRSSFAKDIALGVSLGNIFTQSLSRHLKPFIVKTSKIEDDMKPWLDFVIESICKLIGVSIALALVRVVSAFHSAIKGGALITRELFKFLTKQGLAPSIVPPQGSKDNSGNIEQNIESNTFFIIVQYVLAMYGFYYQLSSGFALGFLLRLILFPFVIVEGILTILAAY